MYSSERLVLEIVVGAVEAGAVAANHAEVEGPVLAAGRLIGVGVHDRLTGDRVDVRASIIVDAAGPATHGVAGRLLGRRPARSSRHSIALNVVVPGLSHTVAFSVASRSATSTSNRKLFVVPWRGRTMIGTGHYPFDGDPERFEPHEADVERFLRDVNAAWAGRPLTSGDVLLLHAGLGPDVAHHGRQPALLQRHRVIDHATDGAPSLVSAVSAKYTTGRLAAEEVVNLVFRKLGRAPPPCRTAATALPGAPDVAVAELVASAVQRFGGELEPTAIKHLVRSHGSRFERVLAYRHTMNDWKEYVPGSTTMLRAAFAHAVAEEMAVRPQDLVCRRTEIHATGSGGHAALRYAEQVLYPDPTCARKG